MKRISLIIPFYGVEKYIRTCLESVYNQDLPESEYEVICVNDCSPDNSESIVREFMEIHDNLLLLCHETNLKLGAARNTGLRYAQGEYVWFIDSDDYIRSNSLQEITKICENEVLDILHWSIQDNFGRWILRLDESGVYSGVDDLLHGSRDMTYPWNRVYKRDFLLRNNLWFNHLWGGDVIHTIQSLNAATRIKNVPDCFYFYRVDNSSSDMRSPITANKVLSFSFILGRALEDCITSLNPLLHPLLHECVEWRVNQSFKPILRLPINERVIFYKTMSGDTELRQYVLKTANRRVKLTLRFPILTFLLSFPYRVLRKIRYNND